MRAMLPNMFDLSHTKRKRDTLTDDDGEDDTQANFLKRRRSRPIESGLAALSLDPTTVHFIPSAVPSPVLVEQLSIHGNGPEISSPLPSTSTSFSASSLPISTEERSRTSVREVQMKSSSWYEPEKDRECLLLHHIFALTSPIFRFFDRDLGIVILDLDSSSDSGDEAPASLTPDSDETPLTVSSAVLAKLNQLPRLAELPIRSAEESGLAVVLFKPPRWEAPFSSPNVSLDDDQSTDPRPAYADIVPMELDP